MRINERIRAREVRVILAATNEQLGVMRLDDAIRRARSFGLDLVEIAPNAQPPVCRIVDFGKFRYDLAKQEKEKKHVVTKVKEIKFRVNIDEHDYLTKIRHAEDFLDKGNKVKIQLQFRGREMAHQNLGLLVVQRVREDLAGMAHVDMEPKLVGRAVGMTLSPLPANKRHRKFTKHGEILEPEPQEAPHEEDEHEVDTSEPDAN
ncbi:MAG: translation initiation factor IF-3 [Spartobacteria bacterium AMD-G4]|nr:MAG: translation initiation factor IF-3 [Spartobacteria bacterium AMD-G4]